MDTFVNSPMLIRQEGEIIKDQWLLEGEQIAIGRDPGCEIVLPSRWISRVHARLRKTGNQLTVEDAGSKNGLFVNGRRILKPHVLLDGDKLQLAPGLDLIFVDSEATAPLPGRAGPRLRLDNESHQVYIKGVILFPPLSSQQFKILATLSENPGKIYSRYEIINAAWPQDNPDGVTDDALDAMMRRLRQRLLQADPDYEYIVTARGYGFKLNL